MSEHLTPAQQPRQLLFLHCVHLQHPRWWAWNNFSSWAAAAHLQHSVIHLKEGLMGGVGGCWCWFMLSSELLFLRTSCWNGSNKHFILYQRSTNHCVSASWMLAYNSSRLANLEHLKALRLFYPPVCAPVLDSLTVGYEVCMHTAVDLLKVHQHVQHIRLSRGKTAGSQIEKAHSFM